MQFKSFAIAALSLGSAIAAPATQQSSARDLQVLTTAVSSVSTVKTTVTHEVQQVTSLINVDASVDINITLVENLLEGVGKEVASLLDIVEGLVGGLVLPLAEDEITKVLGLVKDVHTIIGGVKDMSTGVVHSAPQQIVTSVKPELQFVISSVQPLVKQLKVTVFTLIGDVVAPVVDEVQSLLSEVETLAGGLVSDVLKITIL
ncbi:hypothetical protein F4780DRAFT_781524 [Xylariomycetidae sp. FL0641]|nr:hypothetical protein F4780DRAFT_781524 [Xylariomycetidae sp. FL0641]